ncbi:hypothetical protein FJ951_26975 [Mesorhizobium sp. B2-2-3]|uniref:hypothetical protein n=1 Tax=Mesorhizobium sp. B2-2-3 TaxID=2589963 RepID=UPI001128DAB6|nr:hypothetical protein [Mesorhizobium sp. B2-2-3]TPM39354.1 hypothetical protein FJ951_26975 [Mesorhizobium sp. B2-2-3]
MDFWHDGLSRPLASPKLRVLSLGAGVQSTTLALMAARGDIAAPDCAIFADTGDEPQAVYEHLAWLCSGVLPFPVHIAQCDRSLRAALMAGDEDGARIPWHVGRGGMGGRNCTRNWKIRPIRRKIRELLGVGLRGYVAPGAVESWVGISLDEITRIKPSGCLFIHNRHPLIEARMTRQACYRWLEERQYRIPPKSRCKYCPFQGNEGWRSLWENPDEWAETVELDGWLREPAQIARFHGQVYLHHSRVPLAEANIALADTGPDLFGHECEGMCGV